MAEHIQKKPKVNGNCLIGPPLQSSRNVDEFEKLHRIEEGAYGVVYKARDKKTGEIVALKKLKLENEKDGFPVTSIREIHTLKLCSHPNIVKVTEIVTTSNLNQYMNRLN
jgi:cell division cycle 2-like protein